MAEEPNDEKVLHIEYQLSRPQRNFHAKMITSELTMPTGLPPRLTEGLNYSSVVHLDTMNSDEAYCLKLMKTVLHKNILHVEVVKEVDSAFLAWTEPYTGRLIDFLGSLESKLGCATTGSSVNMIPSHHLQGIISQIFDGVDQLWLNGLHHGHFSLEETYYVSDFGNCVVKLTHFKEKEGKSLMDCKIEDCLDIAKALDQISGMAAELNASGRQPPFDCCQIDELSKKLKQASITNVSSVLKDSKKACILLG